MYLRNLKIVIDAYLTDIFPLEVKDIGNLSGECRTPLMRPFSQSSLPLQRQTSYILSTFCTEHNVQECLLRISQVGNLMYVLSDTACTGSSDS